MKKLATLVLVIAVCSASAIAQSKTVADFHNKYKGDRDAKMVSISGGLFNLLSSIASWDEEDEDAQVVARIADNIKSMDILSIPLYRSGFSHEDIDKMRSDLAKEDYEEMMTARDGDEKVYFLTQGDKSSIKNMLVLIHQRDEFAVININGSLAMEDLAYLVKHHDDWN